jgi:hypothetical protein
MTSIDEPQPLPRPGVHTVPSSGPVSLETLVVLLLSITAFPGLLQTNSGLATMLAGKNRFFGFLEALHPSATYFAYDHFNGLLTCLGTLLLILYLAADLLGNAAVRCPLPGPAALTEYFRNNSGRTRSWLLACILALFVAYPTLYGMGLRYAGALQGTHDGGVLQTEAAMDFLLQGENPYSRDYYGTEVEANNSSTNYWKNYGSIPIMHHLPYLPFSFLSAIPLKLAAKLVLGWYDQRLFHLLAAALGCWLLCRLTTVGPSRRMLLAAVYLNPYVTPFFIEGRNDILVFVLLLAALYALKTARPRASLVLLALACCTKQFTWVFLPFYLLLLAGRSAAARPLADLLRSALGHWRRGLLFAMVCGLVTIPFLAWDPAAFLDDTLFFNAGSSEHNYPLGGTPGFGAANLVLYFQLVETRNDYFPFIIPILLIGLPLAAGLLLVQKQRNSAGVMLACGSLTLLVVAFLSRLFHDNHLGLILMWVATAALADDFFCSDPPPRPPAIRRCSPGRETRPETPEDRLTCP